MLFKPMRRDLPLRHQRLETRVGFNNLIRRVAERVVVRSMTGHASEDMTDYYSWVDAEEKRTAVASVVALVQRANS